MVIGTGEYVKHIDWFKQVFLEYEGTLIRYTKKIVWDEDISKDIVQDCFTKLWGQDMEKVKDKIPPWLYIVCKNQAIDHLRKSRRMTTEVDDSFQVDANQESAFVKTEILREMTKLSSRHQEVLVLKFQEGMSYKEISQVMKVTESHVGLLVHEGIKVLRAKLGGQNEQKN